MIRRFRASECRIDRAIEVAAEADTAAAVAEEEESEDQGQFEQESESAEEADEEQHPDHHWTDDRPQDPSFRHRNPSQIRRSELADRSRKSEIQSSSGGGHHRRRRRREERERESDVIMTERGMSPETRGGSPKRARGGSIRSSSEDGSNNNVHSSARFLISNSEAGSIIGKGGATISEMQTQSGARIQLSRSQDFFPGTNDRIVVLSGDIDEVLAALNLILCKIQKENGDDNHPDTQPAPLRLVVPNSVCGAIIGKGGATIKSFIEESEASIKLSGMLQGISDRLVTITGGIEQQLKVVHLILSKLLGDSNYTEYATAPLSYGGSLGMPVQNRASRSMPSTTFTPSLGGVAGKGMIAPILPMRSQYPVILPVLESCPVTTSITLAVPDEHIGAIVGRGGKTLGEIQQASGVTIKISERGDFVSGTKNRKVTLVGTAEGLQLAQYYLSAKVQGAKVDL